MDHRSRRWAAPLLLFFLLACVAYAAAPGKPAGKQDAKPDKPPKSHWQRPTDPALYAGAEACAACHEDIAKSHELGPHWKTKFSGKGPEWQGCESCHGPGQAHIEGGGDVTKIFRFKQATADEASARCMDCHQFSDEHANFGRSQHLKNGVGCTQCHSAHKPKVVNALLLDKQPQLCYSCHLEVKPDFVKPTHHRVNEGLMTCSDCHNPHGGFLTRQVRATAAQDQVCFKCHFEKTGPFVFEHAPVKTEGCVACHTPHGSTNPRLLKRANINLLCLECHTFTVDSPVPGTPGSHNQAQKYQACTMCHAQIHGSNFHQFFFR